MVMIVVLIVTVAGATVYGLGQSGLDSTAVHGAGAYEFEVTDDNRMRITPQAVDSRDSTFVVRINGVDTYEWDGQHALEVTCLFPNDRIQIYTRTDGNTNLLVDRTVGATLECSLGLVDRFKYVIVNGDQFEVGSRYEFDLAIDPDGPGTDATYGNDVFKQDIGSVPLSNDWHYSKMYDHSVEGMGPPVWVYVMTDNVHWRTANAHPSLNWTDPPPSGATPGQGTYHLDASDDIVTTPSQGAGEPTNDLYMVFEPGCDGSEVLLVNEEAGYDNWIMMDGEPVIEGTDGESDNSFSAPAIPCPN